MNRKPHIEFEMVSNENGWETPLGYPKGIKQELLEEFQKKISDW